MTSYHVVEYVDPAGHGCGAAREPSSLTDALGYRPPPEFAARYRLFIVLVSAPPLTRRRLFRWHEGLGGWRPLK